MCITQQNKQAVMIIKSMFGNVQFKSRKHFNMSAKIMCNLILM